MLQVQLLFPCQWTLLFGDNKGVIRIRISKKNRQHNDQMMFGSSLLSFILLQGDPCFIYVICIYFVVGGSMFYLCYMYLFCCWGSMFYLCYMYLFCCWGIHVLFMLYVFIFVYHCPTSLDFCVLYCRPLFVFWPFHCLFLIYNFRLPLWYLQTFYVSWRPGGTRLYIDVQGSAILIPVLFLYAST